MLVSPWIQRKDHKMYQLLHFLDKKLDLAGVTNFYAENKANKASLILRAAQIWYQFTPLHSQKHLGITAALDIWKNRWQGAHDKLHCAGHLESYAKGYWKEKLKEEVIAITKEKMGRRSRHRRCNKFEEAVTRSWSYVTHCMQWDSQIPLLYQISYQ